MSGAIYRSDILYQLARECRLTIARRFLAQAEATFTRIAGMPGIGTPFDLDQPLQSATSDLIDCSY